MSLLIENQEVREQSGQLDQLFAADTFGLLEIGPRTVNRNEILQVNTAKNDELHDSFFAQRPT